MMTARPCRKPSRMCSGSRLGVLTPSRLSMYLYEPISCSHNCSQVVKTNTKHLRSVHDITDGPQTSQKSPCFAMLIY